jgi:hypothetical protein
MSHLEVLNGKKIELVEFNLSSIEEINCTKEDKSMIELHLFLKFDEYSLSIFNEFNLLGNIENVNELMGDTLIKITEKENYIDFIFKSGEVLRVNMQEEGYIGPEAMHLVGKEGIDVVWN